MTIPNARRPFRLPHEASGAPRNPVAPQPRVTTKAHSGHDSCTVDHVTDRRRSAQRTVASITTGIAFATGLAALGTGWVAQQATAASAAADTSAVDSATAAPLSGPTALTTASDASTQATVGGRRASARATSATTAKRSKTGSTRTGGTKTGGTTATRTTTSRTRPPVVKVTTPPAANPVHAGTHSS